MTDNNLIPFNQVCDMAKSAAESQLFGKSYEEILCIMLMAKEFGLPLMSSLNGGIWVIKTKRKNGEVQINVELSARTINSLIRRNGHELKLLWLDDTLCRLWGKRHDTHEELEVSYGIEDAQRAGLVTDWGAWSKTPKDMLFARAISAMGRRLFADVIGNAYVEGEIRESANKQTLDAIEEMPQVPSLEEKAPFEIPEDKDASVVESYIEAVCSHHKLHRQEVIAKAVARPEEFWTNFNKWQQLQAEKVAG